MAVFLPDPFDDWAAILEEPVMRAMRTWLDEHVRPSVFRALLAAADDEEVMPNIEAILAAAAAWDLVLAQEMTPTQIGLIAARVAAMTDARGVDVAALPRAAGLRDELADALDEAMVAMTRAGVATGQMAVIIDTATWVDFIDDYARAAVNRVSGMPESVYREMVQALAKAVKDGMNPQDRAALVREFLDLDDPAQYERWRRRAQTIARTETNSLINAADLEAGRMEQHLTGEEMHKAWLCVAPDTVVGAIDVRHAARREYVGTLVRITTASGRELSLTPEHPVLTGRGWVAAGDLDLSDNLFQVVHAQTPGAPDVQDSPPGIGQVVDAAMNASDAKVRTVRSGVDLNVDAKAHDVEVVVADRDLSVNLEAVVAERSRDLHLTSADALAHALVLRASGPLVGAGRHRSTAGLFSDSAVLLGLHRGVFSAGADDSSGGLTTDGNPGFPENTADHVVAGAVAIADSVEGVSGGVLSDDGRSVYVGSSPGRDSELLGGAGLLGGGGVAIEPKARPLTRRSGADAAFGESAADGAVVRSDGGGDLLEGVSGLVEADDLVDIERYSFVGHVYDLETAGHWYQANGLVVHNCTLDRRTRDSHFQADGQRVPLDGKFTIGGHECDHPGDQHLPVHEAANCRCSLLLLDADEPLPDESDRQTERERADGTRRDPQAEVRRRAADGVTRARDDAPQTVTAAMKEQPMRTSWSGVLAPIDKPTGDGRVIDSDADIKFREFPLPLMFQRATSAGHDTAVVVGKISTAVVEGGAIHATGELFDTDDAAEARELLAEGVIRPSVDMCDMVVDFTVVDGDGKKVDPEVDEWDPSWSETMHVRSATIMAATLVSKPAFAEAKIVLGDEVASPDDAEEETAALVASAVALAPVDAAVDSAAFADPGLDGPTALTVTDDGRVFGHLALWGTEHVGIGRGVTPPHSKTDYALFHVSTVATDEGPISVGRLTVGCGHAGPRDGAHAATEHYDQTGTCWAYVRAGEDAHGIWVAGIINPDADTATVRAGASAPLSGDWRSVGGNLELVAALSVNTPGFPVPRAYAAAEGAEMSLVAAAVMPRRTREDVLADAVAEGLRRYEERRATAEATEARTVEARRMAASLLAGGIK
ncbi:hypothetical protein CHAN_03345 [Corynebacterium hansenii]|nr:hypothetical protein CHAN_03345 [Corynebacterium hansenii]